MVVADDVAVKPRRFEEEKRKGTARTVICV